MTYDEARKYFGLIDGERFDVSTLRELRLHTQERIKRPIDARDERQAKLMLEAIDAALLEGEIDEKSETQPN